MNIDEILSPGHIENLWPVDLEKLQEALSFGRDVELGRTIPPDRLYVPYHPVKTGQALAKVQEFIAAWEQTKLDGQDLPDHILDAAYDAADRIQAANQALQDQKQFVVDRVPDLHYKDLVRLVILYKIAIKIFHDNRSKAKLIADPLRPVLTMPHSGTFVSQEADPETVGAAMLGEIIQRNMIYQQADPEKRKLALMAHLSSGAPQRSGGGGYRKYG